MELHPVGAAAIWGFCGAFIFAGPKWGAHFVADPKSAAVRAVELAIALSVGSIFAAAYGRLALTMTGISDQEAVSASLGLAANVAAPAIVKRLSAIMAGAVGGLAERDKGNGE